MHGRALQTISHKKNHLDLWGYFNICRRCAILFFSAPQNNIAIKWNQFWGWYCVYTRSWSRSLYSEVFPDSWRHVNNEQVSLNTVTSLGPLPGLLSWEADSQTNGSHPAGGLVFQLLPLTSMWGLQHLHSILLVVLKFVRWKQTPLAFLVISYFPGTIITDILTVLLLYIFTYFKMWVTVKSLHTS